MEEENKEIKSKRRIERRRESERIKKERRGGDKE